MDLVMRATWLWALLVLLLTGTSASAHSLGVECRIREGKVEVAAFFSDKTLASDAEVRVINAEKRVVANGRTDSTGKWTFAVPPAGRYQVVVDAGDGHRRTRPFEIVSMSQRDTQRPVPEDTVDVDSSVSDAILVSEGPTREEFTAFPWLKLGIGLVAIFAFWAAFLIARRARPAIP